MIKHFLFSLLQRLLVVVKCKPNFESSHKDQTQIWQNIAKNQNISANPHFLPFSRLVFYFATW